MKKHAWAYGVCFAAVGCLLLAPPARGADEQADREALQKIRDIYEEAVKSEDLSKLFPHLARNFTAVAPTGVEVKGAQELQSYFKSIWELIGKGGAYQVKVNANATEFHGDIAVSYGTTDEFVKTAEGKEYKFPMLWTAISRRENGAWKALRMHGSMDPLTNVFVQTRLDATRWIYGGGGLLFGLVIGFFLAALRRTRS